jgi:NAD(P)-dependent dehydrogenase (short-subunit alcohol dehydrogenase family)
MTVDGTALVTGASAGIGRALSVEFAANGHDVALVARREDELRALADRLEDDHDVSAHVLVKDLARGLPRVSCTRRPKRATSRSTSSSTTSASAPRAPSSTTTRGASSTSYG